MRTNHYTDERTDRAAYEIRDHDAAAANARSWMPPMVNIQKMMPTRL